LALPERARLFEKIPGGIFELNETQTNPESWNIKTSKLQPTIELAESSLQIWTYISTMQNWSCHRCNEMNQTSVMIVTIE